MASFETIDDLMTAFYDAVSYGPGETPNSDRLRALFLPNAVLVPPVDDEIVASALDLEAFIEASTNAREAAESLVDRGFYETELARRTETFASVASVTSTYEVRWLKDDSDPFVRGINFIQLVYRAGRWWISSVAWDDESPTVNLPDRYTAADSTA